MRAALIWASRNVWVAWLMLMPVIWRGIDWSLDRHPPFGLLQTPAVVQAHRGGSAIYMLRVRRDLDRECSVGWQRYIIDQQGVRHDFSQHFRLSADKLRAMSEAMGIEWLRVAVEVPMGAAVGPARVVTHLRYACNPLHRWWPIEVTMQLPLMVLP